MNIEGNVIGVIVATNTDRNRNELVLRGSLPFFGKPIIELVYDALVKSNVKMICVYTVNKGMIIKNILKKKVKYILKTNEYIYNMSTIGRDFKNQFADNQNLLFIDAKYPFVDSEVLNNLINFHNANQNDLSIIKGEYVGTQIFPNIFIISVQILDRLLNNQDEIIKQIDITKIFEYAKSAKIKIGTLNVDKIYKVLSLTNFNVILNVEAIFLKRK